MSNKALLVIDVQNRLFKLKNPIHNPEQLIDNVNILIEKARCNNSTIIFIQHENSTTLKYGNSNWFLHSHIRKNENDVFIRKTENNSFYETPLKDILSKEKIDSLFICGLLSNLCVKQTCLGAIKLQFNTTLVSDAHSNNSSIPEKIKQKVNSEVNKNGVNLLTTAEVNFI